MSNKLKEEPFDMEKVMGTVKGILSSVNSDFKNAVDTSDELATAKRKESIIDWIVNSNVGDSIVYYQGYLARDRDPALKQSKWANYVGRLFWTAGITPPPPTSDSASNWARGVGMLQLSQKKVDNGIYMYIARKIKDIPEELKPSWKKTFQGI